MFPSQGISLFGGNVITGILQWPKFFHSVSHFVQEPGGETGSDSEQREIGWHTYS